MKMEFMKAISVVGVFLLVLLAGCGTNQPVPPAQTIEVSDDFKIEIAVYGYLLNKHPWDGGKYAAIFLQSSDDRVAALIKQFPHQVPPLKPAVRAQPRPNQAPLDKDTGKPGILLSAKAMDPTNGVSEAIGSWNGGETVSGVYAFVLVEMNGEWTIQSVQ
jgi:hypothetical protein